MEVLTVITNVIVNSTFLKYNAGGHCLIRDHITSHITSQKMTSRSKCSAQSEFRSLHNIKRKKDRSSIRSHK